jgi:hypothetical protein
MIIPVYEAKTLFANIDQIVTAAFTFSSELDRATPVTVAEICLRHVSQMTCMIRIMLIVALVRDFRPVSSISRQAG